MNLAFLLRSKTAATLQSWACRWVFGYQGSQAPLVSGSTFQPVDPLNLLPAAPIAQSCVQHKRPLRVVRVIESGQPCAHVGRMVISGRMADVCAELDRLAAREADDHCVPRAAAAISC